MPKKRKAEKENMNQTVKKAKKSLVEVLADQNQQTKMVTILATSKVL